jgi:hypothetical protein
MLLESLQVVSGKTTLHASTRKGHPATSEQRTNNSWHTRVTLPGVPPADCSGTGQQALQVYCMGLNTVSTCISVHHLMEPKIGFTFEM